MNIKEIEMGLALTGRYVDEQVASGKRLDDVLAKVGQRQSFWHDKENLRNFSEAVRSSMTN
ncbi:hypothetical protein [Stenotrophomonas maltophilia]|uniref:hypothetical protein n=1 Tax=Stenotrophomonas maltophilia TaxID=40324 RepID=UPI0015DE8C93|nr:hypothetical protein [Stenotrophomonas maltophilia]